MALGGPLARNDCTRLLRRHGRLSEGRDFDDFGGLFPPNAFAANSANARVLCTETTFPRLSPRAAPSLWGKGRILTTRAPLPELASTRANNGSPSGVSVPIDIPRIVTVRRAQDAARHCGGPTDDTGSHYARRVNDAALALRTVSEQKGVRQSKTRQREAECA